MIEIGIVLLAHPAAKRSVPPAVLKSHLADACPVIRIQFAPKLSVVAKFTVAAEAVFPVLVTVRFAVACDSLTV